MPRGVPIMRGANLQAKSVKGVIRSVLFPWDPLVVLALVLVASLMVAFTVTYFSDRLLVDDFEDHTGLGIEKVGPDILIATLDRARRVFQTEMEISIGQALRTPTDLTPVRPMAMDAGALFQKIPPIKGVDVAKILKFAYEIAYSRSTRVKARVYKTSGGIECVAALTSKGAVQQRWQQQTTTAQISTGDGAILAEGIAYQVLFYFVEARQNNMESINVQVPAGASAPDLPAKLTFSSWESLRSFTQALEALQLYEKTSEPARLDEAAKLFKGFTEKYPLDLVGSYYMGLVHEMQGLGTMPQAVEVFRKIKTLGSPDLSLPASYNLGLTLLEEYTPESVEQAIRELQEVITKIDLALPNTAGKPSEVQYKALKARAKAVLAHCYIELIHLKHLQAGQELTDWELAAEQRLTEAEELSQDISSKVPLAVSTELSLMLHNSRGSLAYERSRSAVESVKETLLDKAEEEFKAALGLNPNWLDSLSNLGALYREENKADDAIIIFNRVLALRPGDEYANYNLGLISWDKKERQKAREFLRKAPSIPGAKQLLRKIH